MQIDVGIVSILIGLAFQTGGMIWWASNVTARLKHLEDQNASYGPLEGRLARLEEGVKAVGRSIDRLYSEIQQKADKS